MQRRILGCILAGAFFPALFTLLALWNFGWKGALALPVVHFFWSNLFPLGFFASLLCGAALGKLAVLNRFTLGVAVAACMATFGWLAPMPETERPVSPSFFVVNFGLLGLVVGIGAHRLAFQSAEA